MKRNKVDGPVVTDGNGQGVEQGVAVQKREAMLGLGGHAPGSPLSFVQQKSELSDFQTFF